MTPLILFYNKKCKWGKKEKRSSFLKYKYSLWNNTSFMWKGSENCLHYPNIKKSLTARRDQWYIQFNNTLLRTFIDNQDSLWKQVNLKSRLQLIFQNKYGWKKFSATYDLEIKELNEHNDGLHYQNHNGLWSTSYILFFKKGMGWFKVNNWTNNMFYRRVMGIKKILHF